MKITIGNEGRYNFHNAGDIFLRIAPEKFIFADNPKTVLSVKLTPSQIRRINKHFCGMRDCCCGSGPRGIEYVSDDEAVIHLADVLDVQPEDAYDIPRYKGAEF